MGKLIDLTGRKVGDWEVLRREKTEKSIYHYWLCRCKCGFEKCFTSTHIQNSLKGGCGCAITLVGKRFGKLIATDRIAKTGYGKSVYLCKCDCGNERKIRARYLVELNQTSCGCEIVKNSKHTGVRIIYNTYKRNAKRREIEFNITKDELEKLVLSKCGYCSGGYTNSTKENYRAKKVEFRILKHNGIDRIDNSKGYTIENCISCCGICNMMKREFSVKEWIGHMRKVLENITKPKAGV
jgi:hypothetical protein